LNEYEIDFGHHGRTTIIDIAGPPEAPAVMLLHGLGATARLNWAPSFRPLAQHFRVLSLDHRGHGRGLRTRRFELEQCAADAAAAARARRVHRLVAVGYSMGGPIASLLWHKHRGLVDGLVLCATAHDLVPARVARAARLLLPTAAALASWMPGRAHEFMFGDLLRRVESPELREHLEQEVSRHDPASVIQALHQLATFSSHAWLRTIDVPTAVLVMTQDRLVPPDRQYALAAAIPGAQVYEVAGNHLSCVGQPELFVPTLIRACRDVQWRARRAPRQAGI
jgi:3-oxoadipate enol-lactonase